MITEHNYTELMKNCLKWNNRTMSDRKKRLRYPYYDQQTGTAQRESQFATRTIDYRHASTDPNTYLEYSSQPWRKKKNLPPSDAIETKMFLRDNPALDAAVNQTNNVVYNEIPSELSNDSFSFSNDSFATRSRGTPKTLKEEYRDELLLDDDASPDEGGSDEDDWSSKRKRRQAAKTPTTKKRAGRPSAAASAATTTQISEQSTSDEKRHVCDKCGAKYKSLAGLSYHLAYVHEMPSKHPPHKLLSPNIQVSDFCDLCLGSSFMNKNSKRPEDLVTCHDCGRAGHPSCLSFNKNVTVIIARYGWQCIECKSCTICGTSENDDKLLFCDDCDRGYHLYCLKPPLEKAPDDEYSCRLCQAEFGDKASAPVGGKVKSD